MRKTVAIDRHAGKVPLLDESRKNFARIQKPAGKSQIGREAVMRDLGKVRWSGVGVVTSLQ
jgi:hypothetical protein